MSPLGTTLGTVLAYIAIAVLLLSLNLRTRWRWWIKAGGIVVTTLFFGATYSILGAMLGWPAPGGFPPRFSLLSTKIVDPETLSGEAGRIFLWVDELDANNVPMPRPRALAVTYSDQMAKLVRTAQERLDDGESVMGEFLGNDADVAERDAVPVQEEGEQELMAATRRREGASMFGAAPIGEALDQLSFRGLPPPLLPDKGVQ